MNNLIFNNIASELKTSMYAQASDSSLQVLQIDNDGSLKTAISNSSLTVAVSNSITIANDSLTVAVNNPITVANSITIANDSLTVAVSNPITVANSITIANDSLTVAVSNPITIANDSLTVAVSNPITIANDSLTVAVSNPITIANSSISVNIIGNTFTSSSVLNTATSGTGTILNNTDISTLRTASFLVYNLGTNTLTVSLQVSPTTNEADYITDPSYSNFAVLGGGKQIITVSRFARYTRLIYTLGGTTATFSVYFNAQS